jgi:hypothetical protein
MRPFKTPQSLRPSIHDLATFLLFPQTQPARCASQLTRSARPSHWSQNIRTFPKFRTLSVSASQYNASPKPKSRDRGPRSSEDTQTDFGVLDVLGNTAQPSTSIDACLSDGFHLDNGVKITDGDGVLLVSGEAFTWRPWELVESSQPSKGQGLLVNKKGQFEVLDEGWGIFDLVWPKPGMVHLRLPENCKVVP